MRLSHFHPAVAAWFEAAFAAPTAAQTAAWAAIGCGRHALVAAPTGSGKTLAAFLTAIDALIRAGLAGDLQDETRVVYVSPLKALSNDIRINLETPLAGIRAELRRRGLPEVAIRCMVRSGDTPQVERTLMRKQPPHIVVTTPESLYILLGSESGRRMLATTRSVIVDEIHALAPNKRGSHLALSLERLDALCGRRLLRIGLSATIRPVEEVARFLVGNAHVAADGKPACRIVDIGHARPRDLGIEVPDSKLAPVMSNEVWEQVYARLAALVSAHRTTLVFVNTRRMTERVARHLSDRLGKDQVAAHHGSMARELRLDAEQRLKAGALRVLVATASLELGIDIGEVELVCQIGSPRSILAFLQRVGRSGHALSGTPKGRLFPQSRDDLVECVALLDAVRRGELDTLHVLPCPIDVLAQQIVAEVACQEWREDELFERFSNAYSHATLNKDNFAAILRMLAEGFTTRRGPRAAYLHRDAVNGVLRARRGARLTAITSGGAIPDTADYQVVLEPQAQIVGSVHEDFAVESLAGDVFQLGNTAYRILRIEQGRVRVEDAKGLPPSVPFWLGEAPGRSAALSFAVSRLREEIAARFPKGEALDWLMSDLGLDEPAAHQLLEYLASASAALGVLPTQNALALERFFDESGGTQLVIHSPYGSRINRAWGLALRKRFCRSFNFELQAAASEDAIVLSLSTSHSFPLEDVARYLHSNSAREVLVQALLDAPMFGLRWRWNASIALALPRFAGGRKVPAPLQRMRSEDLLATVFPDQVACLENIVGEREIPDHPLVQQTLRDCLFDAMDVEGLLAVLRGLESGSIRMLARDLTTPSPLAAEILNARPYAFLDDAPLEERRTQAVANRRWGDPAELDDFGRLDPAAIASVRAQAWPQARDADELHAALQGLGVITASEADRDPRWKPWLIELGAAMRACRVQSGAAEQAVWCCAERLPQWQALHPDAPQPPIAAPVEFATIAWTRQNALIDLLRARLTGLGPTTVSAVAQSLDLSDREPEVEAALVALESEGFVMRGHFSPRSPGSAPAQSRVANPPLVIPAQAAIQCAPQTSSVQDSGPHPHDAEQHLNAGASDGPTAPLEWCERHLLARIHRYTVQHLRREIEPAEPRDVIRFLLHWQHLAPSTQISGPESLDAVLAQLEGFEAPAAAWESEILPARIAGYAAGDLDALCLAGQIVWSRLRGSASQNTSDGPVRATPIVLLQRRNLSLWNSLAARSERRCVAPLLSSRGQRVIDALSRHGALFFDELAEHCHLLQAELEDALGEAVAAGLVNCDSFAGLRALLIPAARRSATQARRGRRPTPWSGIRSAGRWALVRRDQPNTSENSSQGRLISRPATGDANNAAGGTTGSAARAGTATGAAHELNEQIVRTLLRRYGVLCWRLLEREADWLPPWRDLVRACQRLEARGELRGGRFIAGLAGEQFALPEAIAPLRRIRNQAYTGELTCVCGADPLNVVGSLLAGARIPALTGTRLLYRDGLPLASWVGGEFSALQTMTAAEQWSARNALLRGTRTLSGTVERSS